MELTLEELRSWVNEFNSSDYMYGIGGKLEERRSKSTPSALNLVLLPNRTRIGGVGVVIKTNGVWVSSFAPTCTELEKRTALRSEQYWNEFVKNKEFPKFNL